MVVEEAAVESPGSPVDDKSVSEYVPTKLGGDDDAGLSVGDEIETLDADASMRGSIKRLSDTPSLNLRLVVPLMRRGKSLGWFLA